MIDGKWYNIEEISQLVFNEPLDKVSITEAICLKQDHVWKNEYFFETGETCSLKKEIKSIEDNPKSKMDILCGIASRKNFNGESRKTLPKSIKFIKDEV